MRTRETLTAVVLLLGCSVQAQTPRELAAAASSAMQRGDYRTAESNYAALVKQMPAVAELHSNLGLARLSLGNLGGAEQAFRGALELKPDLPVPKFFLGRMLFHQSRHEEALPLLRAAAAAQPGEDLIRRLVAATLIGLERYSEAIAEYRKLLDAGPNDIETLYELGKVYLHVGQRTFDRLAEFPDSAFFLLANAEFQAERPRFEEVAEDFYRRAVAAQPAHAGLRTALAIYLLRRGEWDGAREAFEQALERDAEAYNALFGRAFARVGSGDWKGAAADLSRAAAIRPEFFRPLPPPPLEEFAGFTPEELDDRDDFGAAYLRWVFTGETARPPTGESRLPAAGLDRLRELLKIGRYSEVTQMDGVEGPEAIYLKGAAYRQLGKAMLERLVAVDPNSARVRQLLGDSLYARELFAEAAEEYQEAAKKRPNDPEILFSLANAWLRQPDHPRATDAYRRLLEMLPTHAEAAHNLGLSLVAQNRHREAVETSQRALELNPGLTRTHVTLGQALAALGETEEALRHLEAGAETDTDGTVHYQLFQLYRKLGLKEKAEAARQRSAELRP